MNSLHVLLRLIVALLLGAVPAAHAVPTLSFSVDGGAAVTCADGDACDLTGPGNGILSFSGALGGVYGVNVTTGITKPAFPGSQMDLNTVTLQTLADGAHTLDIMFSETGFTDLGNARADFGGTISANGSTVAYRTYFGNALFNLGTLMTNSGPIVGPAFSGSLSGPGPVAGPFSMTQVLNLSTNGSGTALSGDFEVRVTPEPGTVALLGLAIAGLGFARRRTLH